MVDYSFDSLNDKEFEVFCIDIISAHLNTSVERFKDGKDKGVDGRYFISDDETIIQCKHWPKTGIKGLISHLEKKEIVKVQALSPKRYIFMTSLELSRENKDKIAQIFNGYILTPSDIFSRENLNDILSKNLDIEKRHYKLWLSSTNIIQLILNSDIIVRSTHTLESIKKDIARYVQTQNHVNAIQQLDNMHSIIITGAPGVGKTTLAEQICYYYSALEFEFVLIEDSIKEAYKVYRDDKKQIFYFDDFLGRNHLLALSNSQDSKIIKFINLVKKDKTKRFVLTSRTNVLNNGKNLSDLFNIHKIDRSEYELTISSLNPFDKARILYNHIWFGNLSETYIHEIYKDKRYHDIISHRKFNPRLISFITDRDRLANVNVNNYWNYITDNLKSPKEVWRNVIETQLDIECRHVVVALVLNYKELSENDLKRTIRNMMINVDTIPLSV